MKSSCMNGRTAARAGCHCARDGARHAPDEIARPMPGRIVALHCDIPEGLQREHLHVSELRLPAGRAHPDHFRAIPRIPGRRRPYPIRGVRIPSGPPARPGCPR